MANEQSSNYRSDQVARKSGGSGKIESSGGNFVASYGNADARVIHNGTGAFAVAKGQNGHAGAYTNGRDIRLEASGNGRAGVDGGMAWAQAENGNVSVSFCGAAQERYKALPAVERQSGKTCRCEDAKCWRKKCNCPCHLVSQKLLGY